LFLGRKTAKDYAMEIDPSKISFNAHTTMEFKDKKKQKELETESRKKEAAKTRKIIALLNHDDAEEI